MPDRLRRAERSAQPRGQWADEGRGPAAARRDADGRAGRPIDRLQAGRPEEGFAGDADSHRPPDQGFCRVARSSRPMPTAETTKVRWMTTYQNILSFGVLDAFMKIFSRWIDEIATIEEATLFLRLV